MPKRGSMRDAVVYALLVLAYLATSSGLQTALCSRFLQCESGYGKSKVVAYMTFAHQLNRTLQASSRQLDALTPSERTDLSRFTHEALQELPHLPEIVANDFGRGFRVQVLAGLPSYFLLGALGMLVHRYRKLFVVPFLEALVAGLFLVPTVRSVLSAGSSWAFMLPELALWIGGSLVAGLGALVLGCICGSGLMRVLQRYRQPAGSLEEQVRPMVSLLWWRSASLAIILVAITLCASTTWALLLESTETDRSPLEETQSPPAERDSPQSHTSRTFLAEGERSLFEFEEKTAASFREIVDSMRDCAPVATIPSE